MPIIKNQHQNELVNSLSNLAGICSQRVHGENGSAFTNF